MRIASTSLEHVRNEIIRYMLFALRLIFHSSLASLSVPSKSEMTYSKNSAGWIIERDTTSKPQSTSVESWLLSTRMRPEKRFFREWVRRFRKTFGFRVRDIAPRWMEHSWNWSSMIQRRSVRGLVCYVSRLREPTPKKICSLSRLYIFYERPNSSGRSCFHRKFQGLRDLETEMPPSHKWKSEKVLFHGWSFDYFDYFDYFD